MIEEQWHPILGYEDTYEVSDHGRVRRGESVLKPQRLRKGGHLRVGLSQNGVRKFFQVHRLVAVAFIGSAPEPQSMVCHRDGNPENNVPANLYWGTYATNMTDMIAHRTQSNVRKTRCVRGHLLVDGNLVPSGVKRGRRECRACRMACTRHWHGLIDDVKQCADEVYASLGIESDWQAAS